MSKLTNEDKQAIQDNITEFKSHSEFVKTMANQLGTTQKAVKEYVDGLFMSMMKIESNTQNQERETIVQAEQSFNDGVLDQTMTRLVKAGLTKDHADRLMKRALSKVDNEKIPSGSDEQSLQLFNLSLGQINSSDIIIKETESGRKGIAIMTEGASARSDDEFMEHKRITHKSRGAVFGTDGQEKTE